MESNRKRRGFMKGKLIPFYRTAKPSSTTSLQYMTTMSTNKVVMKPSHVVSSANSASASTVAPSKPKVSFVLADTSRDTHVHYESIYGVAVDDSVDSKAANYILSVQERFKLERVNSERSTLVVKCQDVRT